MTDTSTEMKRLVVMAGKREAAYLNTKENNKIYEPNQTCNATEESVRTVGDR